MYWQKNTQPFRCYYWEKQPLNLSSGIPLQSHEILKSYEIDQEKYETFVKECIQENSKSFKDPIQKSKLQTFKNPGKAKVTRNEKTAVIDVNRNAIRKLLVISTKFEKKIDFEVALTSVPLSLSNPDVSWRGTQKSKLMELLSQYQEENDSVLETDAKIFVVDFIAQIWVITKEIPETYEQLALKILQFYNFAMNVFIWLLILIV